MKQARRYWNGSLRLIQKCNVSPVDCSTWIMASQVRLPVTAQRSQTGNSALNDGFRQKIHLNGGRLKNSLRNIRRIGTCARGITARPPSHKPGNYILIQNHVWLSKEGMANYSIKTTIRPPSNACKYTSYDHISTPPAADGSAKFKSPTMSLHVSEA